MNPADGTLYVADSGNNRVLRYPRPVSQSGRISPDAVIGQVDFTSSLSAAVSATSLNAPAAWRSDRMGISSWRITAIIGCWNFRRRRQRRGGSARVRPAGYDERGTSNQVSAQTLAAPLGIAVDQASNLYVADAGANRVLIFPNTQNAPVAGAAAAL